MHYTLYIANSLSFHYILLSLQGCVDAVVDRISDQIGVIAGVSITVAVLLVRFALLSI